MSAVQTACTWPRWTCTEQGNTYLHDQEVSHAVLQVCVSQQEPVSVSLSAALALGLTN